ncbi:DNA damage-repair/toleration protein DRT100-like [Coffea eugenioides]|uniref:DNA damage-repair/toleration protein DRT100-like n=1 Tax=Coffea eugenioides TaxID=49369 RepID=UPI000F60D7CE|nr:DNA damage-repair/toleration protein DRT100-like [Coffea eugenioides]
MRSRKLSNIYLAGCKLRGTLPNFTTPDSLSSLDLSDNYFTEDGLSSIDLHSNQLYGSLSSILSNKTSKFLEVERLDISRNQIGGTIPTSLGLLLKLQWLDLSINTLSGKIPDSLLQIEALRHASFRANRLCGEIPQGRPLNIFPPVTYAHNLCLCGRPLPPCKGKK